MVVKKELLNETKEFPERLENIHQIKGTKILYKAMFYHIQLNSQGEISFDACLTKIQEQETFKKKNFFSREKILEKTQKEIWEIWDYNHKNYILMNNYPPSSHFQLTTNFSKENYYKKGLIKNATEQNIILENSLLDKLFDPLERKINEFLK
ncbi:MAG: hypothetical protein KKF48_05095 [Nanoarchaeota archaeon]|nr:hypothetical protein [Nanoarchaeota archaeon]MBU1028394.1 hypothetical protein [Nanoarchaeota archaeon]